MATGQHLSHSEVRHSLRGTSVRGRRYPLIIFASGVKDLDRPAHALSSLHRSVCETGFASLSRSLSEPLAATAVWEYSHYPLDIQMKAKPDHGMDLSGKMRHKGGRKFSANAAADVARPRSILKNIPRYFNRATFYFVTSFSFSATYVFKQQLARTQFLSLLFSANFPRTEAIVSSNGYSPPNEIHRYQGTRRSTSINS